MVYFRNLKNLAWMGMIGFNHEYRYVEPVPAIVNLITFKQVVIIQKFWKVEVAVIFIISLYTM